MKKLTYRGIITTASLIAIASVVIFTGCKKDGKELTNSQKSGTELVNPFEQYGIWHNKCIIHMFSQDVANLTFSELWEDYGVEYYKEVLGADYTSVSQAELDAIYRYSRSIVENQQYLDLLEELVDAGRINPDYISPYIERNNYEILLDYFTFLTECNVVSEDTYWAAYNKLCEIEQEIIANFYALIDEEIIAPEDDVYAEYAETLFSMAIARNSVLLWAPPAGTTGACYALPWSEGQVDAVAARSTVRVSGSIRSQLGKYSSVSAFCSAMAGVDDVAIYVDGFLVSW